MTEWRSRAQALAVSVVAEEIDLYEASRRLAATSGLNVGDAEEMLRGEVSKLRNRQNADDDREQEETLREGRDLIRRLGREIFDGGKIGGLEIRGGEALPKGALAALGSPEAGSDAEAAALVFLAQAFRQCAIDDNEPHSGLANLTAEKLRPFVIAHFAARRRARTPLSLWSERLLAWGLYGDEASHDEMTDRRRAAVLAADTFERAATGRRPSTRSLSKPDETDDTDETDETNEAEETDGVENRRPSRRSVRRYRMSAGYEGEASAGAAVLRALMRASAERSDRMLAEAALPLKRKGPRS